MTGAADIPELRKLLRKRLMQTANYPGDDFVAWENRKFEVPDGTDAWWRETLMVGDTRKTATQQLQTLGILQVDVIVPAGTGTATAEGAAKTIAKNFQAGTNLTDSVTSVSLHIYRAEPMLGRLDPGTKPLWYTVPVRVYWWSHTTTTDP